MIEIPGVAHTRTGPDLTCRLVIEANDHGDVHAALAVDPPPDGPRVVDIDYILFPQTAEVREP